MAKVTGIGGVFFKARTDKAKLAAWYVEHLGVKLESFGAAVLRWKDDTANDGGATVWSLAAPESDWFAPSESPFMINYRIDDMDGMLAQLERGGVPIHKGPETHPNGRFAWIIDPDGNKIELWEPKLMESEEPAE